MPEVVAGGDVGPLDSVELAVLAFLEAVGAGDDHAADRIGAHDVGVVVGLDPLGRGVQAEGLGDAGQELRLGRAFRHFPAERLARIGDGVVDELALLAALGPVDLDLAAALEREGLGEQGAVGGVDVGEDQLGDRPVVVELADEGAHDVGVLIRLVDAGEVGAVAPVLAGAEEEHLDAGLAALGEEGEDVGLLEGRGVDHRLLGDAGQRADAVAQARGALELHVVGGGLHLLGEPAHDQARLALQEVLGLVDEAPVVLEADQAGAGRGAALDLVQHAGARAALVDAVGAGAQQERLLQGVQRLVDRVGRREGAEVVALDGVGAAVFAQLRRRMLAADHDLGEGLVVAQQDVEARLELLDQVDLEQQGVGLCAGGDELHRARQVDHVGDTLGVEAALGVLDDALLQAARLADIEHLALVADHPVDARPIRQALDLVLDQLGPAALQLLGAPRRCRSWAQI